MDTLRSECIDHMESDTSFAKSVELIKLVGDKQRAVHDMTKYYWHHVLGRPYVMESNFRVANLGAAYGEDAIPLSLGLEGKTTIDLYKAVLKKPELHVKVVNFDLDRYQMQLALTSPILQGVCLPATSYCEADIRRLPIADQSVEIAFMRNPDWEHDFPEARDVLALYEEMDRIIRVGGLIWTTHSQQSEFIWGTGIFGISPFKERYLLKAASKNAYPGPQRVFIDDLTQKAVPHTFDQYVVIGEKMQ